MWIFILVGIVWFMTYRAMDRKTRLAYSDDTVKFPNLFCEVIKATLKVIIVGVILFVVFTYGLVHMH